MAFKNIFSSVYAIVENVNYNGPRKSLTFDLVLYRDSSKHVETGRMSYQVDGNLGTKEIVSVITAIPAGLEMEAYPDDFDFDALATFKPYLVGNSPTADEFTEAGCGELKTGFEYLCEIGPQKVPNEAGEMIWPQTPTGTFEQVKNPDYDASIDERNADGSPNDDWEPEFLDGDEIMTEHKISYAWGALDRTAPDTIYVDKDGDYWEVTGNIGSGAQTITQLDAPFLTSDWDTWFSATAMDKVGKNIQERIYTWLKAKPEYKDAVSI
jgi:hypothetical protein